MTRELIVLLFLPLIHPANISTTGMFYIDKAKRTVITMKALFNGPGNLPELQSLQPDYGSFDIIVRSYGAKDKGYSSILHAIFVNGTAVDQIGRGIRVVETFRGDVRSLKTFDNHAGKHIGTEVLNHIKAIAERSLVAIAGFDDPYYLGYTNNSKTALRLVGGKDLNFQYRNAYCLIGYKGHQSPFKIKEQRKLPGSGPCYCQLHILVKQGNILPNFNVFEA